MSEHVFTSSLSWTRTTPDFNYETYDRNHTVKSGSGITLPSSAAPSFKGATDRINPEEMLLSAISSCHMLTFLAVAAKKRFVLESYSDDATAIMDKNAEGKLAVTKATLRPKTTFSGGKQPTKEELTQMHHTAHNGCFVASSVKTEIEIALD